MRRFLLICLLPLACGCSNQTSTPSSTTTSEGGAAGTDHPDGPASPGAGGRDALPSMEGDARGPSSGGQANMPSTGGSGNTAAVGGSGSAPPAPSTNLNRPVANPCLGECNVDDDCGSDSLCFCHERETEGICLHQTCRVDGDCGAGNLCVQVPSRNGDDCSDAQAEYHCTTREDECVDRLECPAFPEDICIYDRLQGRRVCAFQCSG
jgi:hypothetical protein